MSDVTSSDPKLMSAQSRRAKELLTASLEQVQAAVQQGGDKLFPGGITLIELGLTVGSVELSVKVEGPDPNGSAAARPPEG